jgi:hypothetical protein
MCVVLSSSLHIDHGHFEMLNRSDQQ